MIAITTRSSTRVKPARPRITRCLCVMYLLFSRRSHPEPLRGVRKRPGKDYHPFRACIYLSAIVTLEKWVAVAQAAQPRPRQETRRHNARTVSPAAHGCPALDRPGISRGRGGMDDPGLRL